MTKVPGVDDVEIELAKIDAEKGDYIDLDSLKDPEPEEDIAGEADGEDK